MLPNELRISEIFYSLQGETTLSGLPTVFIRLTGCPLRCQYCDSAYAFSGGDILTIDAILQQVSPHKTRHVTVSGGEPLAQPGAILLLKTLCDNGYIVSLETSGALPIAKVDSRVIRILDIKTPDSNEHHRMHLENIDYLQPHDQVKFVICSFEDFTFALAFIEQHKLVGRCELLFSPSYEQLPVAQLADWILTHHAPVRLQIQLHKMIWGDKPGV